MEHDGLHVFLATAGHDFRKRLFDFVQRRSLRLCIFRQQLGQQPGHFRKNLHFFRGRSFFHDPLHELEQQLRQIVFYDGHLITSISCSLHKQQQADEVARKVADEKRRKRRDFLLQLVQALIVAAATLLIEHIPDIVGILRALLQEQS